jgi:hypothetical protein
MKKKIVLDCANSNSAYEGYFANPRACRLPLSRLISFSAGPTKVPTVPYIPRYLGPSHKASVLPTFFLTFLHSHSHSHLILFLHFPPHVMKTSLVLSLCVFTCGTSHAVAARRSTETTLLCQHSTFFQPTTNLSTTGPAYLA